MRSREKVQKFPLKCNGVFNGVKWKFLGKVQATSVLNLKVTSVAFDH